MNLEEELKDLPIADPVGIKDNLDRLRMVSMIAVGGIRHVAARIADARRNHARVASEQVLHSPKAAPGKDRTLG
jgi:hypothetical protein